MANSRSAPQPATLWPCWRTWTRPPPAASPSSLPADCRRSELTSGRDNRCNNQSRRSRVRIAAGALSRLPRRVGREIAALQHAPCFGAEGTQRTDLAELRIGEIVQCVGQANAAFLRHQASILEDLADPPGRVPVQLFLGARRQWQRASSRFV